MFQCYLCAILFIPNRNKEEGGTTKVPDKGAGSGFQHSVSPSSLQNLEGEEEAGAPSFLPLAVLEEDKADLVGDGQTGREFFICL